MLKQYIEDIVANGEQPLPILNRINEKKNELILLNYRLNESNAKSFATVMKDLVPGTLKKLVLIDNNLRDDHLRTLFESLS